VFVLLLLLLLCAHTPQGAVSRLEPELNLLLAVLVFWLSVWRGRATPGSELMNLRYRNERAMDAAAAAAAAGGGACAAAGQAPPSWVSRTRVWVACGWRVC
jgi:peroxin-2